MPNPIDADSLDPSDGAFRRDGLLGYGNEATYAGATSFLRRTYTRDIAAADAVVTGIPFDAATSNRPGARFGPRAIREASTQLGELPGYPFGIDLLNEYAIADVGDCLLDYGNPTQMVELVEGHTDWLLSHGAFVLTFGGDHFITYPVLRAVAKKHGPVALIHFDAHSDTWTDDGVRLDHGTMFARAVEQDLVDPARSTQIGIRTPNDNRYGFEILSAPWVHEHGPAAAVAIAKERAGDGPVYVTFDIDCLDPAFAPGTGTPVPGGLSSAQALAAVRALTELDIVAADVVEVAPAYDHAEITSLVAATIAHDLLCLAAIGSGIAT